jgi:hypothetical protein
MKAQSILFFSFITISAFSQPAVSCRETIYLSMEKYREKDYTPALKLFKKAIAGKCELSENDYYNGACIASLAKNDQLTFAYLNTAINKGFDDIEHMNTDTDLDFVRNKNQYKLLVNKISKKYDYLLSHFKGLKYTDFTNAVPYIVNGKWGWLHKKTKMPLSKPFFDYTDFKNGSGLYFTYKGKQLLYANDLTIKPLTPEQEGDAVMSRMAFVPAIVEDSVMHGFTLAGGDVKSFSNRFTNIYLINEHNYTERIAIATDKENKKGIIREDGTVIQGFDFNFSDIDYFGGPLKQIFFLAKAINSGLYIIYNRKGEVVFNEPVSEYNDFYNYETTPLGKYIYTGFLSYNYTVFKYNSKATVFDKQTQKTIFKISYDKVLMINGPTDGMDRTGSTTSNGITAAYFLVTDQGSTFYVDNTGTEYKVK